MRALWVLLALLSCSCGLGYSSALGFRARQAVLARDINAFPPLMNEAAETLPKGPLDNPKRTVLTHFLDFADDPKFFPIIEDWKSKGWVAEDMVCSIHRAHARLLWEKDRDEAWKSVEMCLSTAREAARSAEKSWQVSDCLEDATFLTQTATTALVPFVERVADPTEPLKFRVALLDGMTRIPVSSADKRQMNDHTLPREQAIAEAEAQLHGVETRFEWIISSSKTSLEPGLLASGSAIGAMEIEEASLGLGRSYVGRYAISENPDDNDLAWAWIRVMKTKKKNPSLSALGIWDRSKETKEDVYWYFCARPATGTASGPAVVDAISVRAKERAGDIDALRAAQCVDKKTSEVYPKIYGPFPLESVGRGAVSTLMKDENGKRTAVVLKRRILM